jgi:hypothetical protein
MYEPQGLVSRLRLPGVIYSRLVLELLLAGLQVPPARVRDAIADAVRCSLEFAGLRVGTVA